jgi:hypothetical protein
MHQHYSKNAVPRKLLQWTARALLTLSVFLTCLPLNGQAEFEGSAFNPKVGLYLSKSFQGFSAGMEFNYIRNQNVLSVDFITSAEFTFSDEPSKYHQIEVLFGRYTDARGIRIHYQGGIAPTWCTQRGHWDDNSYIEATSYFTLGLTGKLGLKIIPSQKVSFGVDLHGNLNLKNPSLIPMFSIEFRMLRERDTLPEADDINY